MLRTSYNHNLNFVLPSGGVLNTGARLRSAIWWTKLLFFSVPHLTCILKFLLPARPELQKPLGKRPELINFKFLYLYLALHIDTLILKKIFRSSEGAPLFLLVTITPAVMKNVDSCSRSNFCGGRYTKCQELKVM